MTLTSNPPLVFAKQLLAGVEFGAPATAWKPDSASGLPPQVEIVRDEAGFAALQPHWDRLLEASSTRSPFQRWDWARLWWESYGAECQLALVVARSAFGVVEAIAPLVIGHATTGARKFLRQLCWLGGLGPVTGEVMDFLVPAGRESELTPLLCQGIRALASEWQALRLDKLPTDSPNAVLFLGSLGAYTAGTGVVNAHASRFTNLPGSWEELAGQRSGRWRRNLRKRWDTLQQLPGLSRGLAGETMDAGAALDALAGLHCGRWCEGSSTFVTESAWEFHRQLGQRWIQEGRALLPYLALDGRMIAGCYGFIEGDSFYMYQLGWNTDYAALSLGNLAVKNLVLHCIDRGLHRFDMLSGDYRYKLDWCPQGRELLDMEAYSPTSPAAACFRGLRSLKRLVCATDRGHEEECLD